MIRSTTLMMTLAIAIPTFVAHADPPGGETADDTLVHEAILDAPLADVWNAFTQEDLIVQWMVPKAELDFRIGGTLRTNYHEDGEIGDEHTIEHTYLAYEKERMIAQQVTKCPANFPYHEEVEQMWSVMYFEPITGDRTRLRLVGIGYGTGGNWDTMRAFFKRANEYEIQQLSKFLASHSESDESTQPSLDPKLEPLKRYLGGQWEVHDQWATGEPLHARTIYELGVGGKFIQAKTYALKPDGTEYQRYETILGWDAQNESLTFTSYTYTGAVASGTIAPTDENTLTYAWTGGSPAASGATIGQSIEFISDDEAHWLVWLETDDGPKQLLDATWQRTSVEPLELEELMEALNEP